MALLGSKEHPDYAPRRHAWAQRLLADEVAPLVAETRQEALGLGRAAAVETELGYFVRNVARMQRRAPTGSLKEEFRLAPAPVQ